MICSRLQDMESESDSILLLFPCCTKYFFVNFFFFCQTENILHIQSLFSLLSDYFWFWCKPHDEWDPSMSCLWHWMEDLGKARVWRQNWNHSSQFNGICASSPAVFCNLVVNLVHGQLYGDYTKEQTMCPQNILRYYAFKLKFIELKWAAVGRRDRSTMQFAFFRSRTQ